MATRNLLWDHDGVLVDTERWYYRATQEVMAGLGLELELERYLAYMVEGKSVWDQAEAAGHTAADVLGFRHQRNLRYQAYLRSESIEIEGVEDVLAELKQQYSMAIVTTSRREDFEIIHANRSIVDHFEFVLTVEDYPRAKPCPDPYQAGLDRFGIKADEAVVIEDSERGLRAAVAAGIRCVVIRHPFVATHDFSSAWKIVDSIQDVPAAVAG